MGKSETICQIFSKGLFFMDIPIVWKMHAKEPWLTISAPALYVVRIMYGGC